MKHRTFVLLAAMTLFALGVPFPTFAQKYSTPQRVSDRSQGSSQDS